MLPAGVKFDPTDQELIEHLEAKVSVDSVRIQSLINLFIPTIDSEHDICYTQPEKLPGKTPIGRLLAQTYSFVYKFYMIHVYICLLIILYDSVLYINC